MSAEGAERSMSAEAAFFGEAQLQRRLFFREAQVSTRSPAGTLCGEREDGC